MTRRQTIILSISAQLSRRTIFKKWQFITPKQRILKASPIQKKKKKNESLRNQEETTAKKQQINSDISKLTAEKTGLENAKKTFEDNLTKYQTEYDILENQSKILRGEIQEIDPDGKKREDMRKEVSSITPQSIGMREINTKELYNNIA